MYLFGGSNGTKDNKKFFKLDLKTFTWEIVETFKKDSLIQPRDSHTAVVSNETKCMYVFGGFSRGNRMNEVYIYSFKDKTWTSNYQYLMGKNFNMRKYEQPQPRNGHSACIYKGKMYVFGGRNNESKQLNDLWALDLSTLKWKEIASNSSEAPLGRTGHSCDIIGHYMVIFGGFQKIANELNDLHIFNFEEMKWQILYE